MTEIKAEQNLPQIYTQAFDSFMPLDAGLNSNMEYIAIDMTGLNLNAQDKATILDYFKKYKVTVMEASFDDLKQKSLFDEKHMILNGILLSIKKVDIKSDTKVQIEGSKYRSGNGAIGVVTTIIYMDNSWQIDKADITWIS
ncbi:hypothetical protein SPSYN_01423 [Sporotomaculum syntrophicum]|uniref:Uncharacterized protein n=2 Tax=Sporotomaculum syntrophicum TaxID=182264 RepID=A0A9D3AXQ7_9FIRM|nr:hypothetical protein SPSYN_01423 [Sporotomaculum syntrophicum]